MTKGHAVNVCVTKVGLSEVKNAFSRWLYLEDDSFIDIGLAAVIANRFQGDPVWLFLIAPSGSTKTEFLRSLSGQSIHHLSDLTPNTLISGLNQPDNKDPSILLQLDGKVVVIKDFTTILNENQKIRSKIFGQLRDIYDGSAAKAFGSGVGTRRYKCHMGILAGVTPAIERYQTVDQVLGERFLNYRLSYLSPERAVETAMRNAGHEDEMREELRGLVRDFLDQDWPNTPEAVTIPGDFQVQIQKLASLVALLRTAVPKNRSGDIQYIPEAEVGTRLVIQLKKIGCALSIVRDDSVFGDEEYQVLLKVAKDSVPSLRWRLVSKLVQHSWKGGEFQATADIAQETKLPVASARQALEDLYLLGMVESRGEKPRRWMLTKRVQTLFETTEALLSNNELQLSGVQMYPRAWVNR